MNTTTMTAPPEGSHTTDILLFDQHDQDLGEVLSNFVITDPNEVLEAKRLAELYAYPDGPGAILFKVFMATCPKTTFEIAKQHGIPKGTHWIQL